MRRTALGAVQVSSLPTKEIATEPLAGSAVRLAMTFEPLTTDHRPLAPR
jgi:hypothetical protein